MNRIFFKYLISTIRNFILISCMIFKRVTIIFVFNILKNITKNAKYLRKKENFFKNS